MSYKTYKVRVYDDGSKWWYLNGKLHREDGPAVEWASGGKSWWLNGKYHREDGPAIERSDGIKSWYLNGEELTEEEWLEKVKPTSCADKVVEVDGKRYKLMEVPI